MTNSLEIAKFLESAWHWKVPVGSTDFSCVDCGVSPFFFQEENDEEREKYVKLAFENHEYLDLVVDGEGGEGGGGESPTKSEKR